MVDGERSLAATVRTTDFWAHLGRPRYDDVMVQCLEDDTDAQVPAKVCCFLTYPKSVGSKGPGTFYKMALVHWYDQVSRPDRPVRCGRILMDDKHYVKMSTQSKRVAFQVVDVGSSTSRAHLIRDVQVKVKGDKKYFYVYTSNSKCL